MTAFCARAGDGTRFANQRTCTLCCRRYSRGPHVSRQIYRQHLKEDLGGLIDALDLSDLNKRFLRSRWLDQVLWTEGAAERANRWYHGLRLVMIVGGILVPALLSLNLVPGTLAAASATVSVTGVAGIASWAAFVLGLVVAISAALEEFFRFGERWRHYRQMAEILKIEGWQYLQLSGEYRRLETHLIAYPNFAGRVESFVPPGA